MTNRLLAATGLLAALLFTATAADTKDTAASKKALQEVGEFIGEWKGNGEAKQGGKNTLWKETLNLGWKFKDGDSWILLKVTDGKFVTKGELRYDPEKKVYTLTVTDAAKKETVYEGKLEKGKLVLTNKDAATGDVRRLSLFTLSEGSRMTWQSEIQTKGKGLFTTEYKVTASNTADSFAGGGGKKPVCVVTEGLGTMTVSYMGKTYYVCCSGCRDEFNANPKKYVEEFEKKQKK